MKQAAEKKALCGEDLARQARLKYVLDDEPGFTRQLNGSGYKYLDCHGKRLKSKRQIERINGLVIPPAWREVWICRYENGHLQATGYDSRQRKQYLYHPHWQEAANREKFARLGDFGQALPSIRRKVQARLRGRKLTRDRVLAGMVAILDATAIRVGHEEYVKANRSYGLSTLRNRHLEFNFDHAVLGFAGKSGIRHELIVKAKPCVRLLRQCHRLPGAHVFQYLDDDGNRRTATAADVNDFLQELTGEPFTAKDFRTWAASVLVIGLLIENLDESRVSFRKKVVRSAVKQAAESLGNTQATSRKYYIHPKLLESYEESNFPGLLSRFRPSSRNCFSKNEQRLAYFLRRLCD